MTLAAVLGLVAAALYGSADFISHFIGKRSGVLRTLCFGQTLLAVVLTVALLAHGGLPAAPAGVWTILIASDVAILIGTACFYQALATGDLAVVPPVTACYGAVAALLSVAAGERVKPWALAGLALAVGGGVLAAIPAQVGRGSARQTAASGSGTGGAGLAASAAALYGVGFWAQGRFAAPRLGALPMMWSYYALGAVILHVVAISRRTPPARLPPAQIPAVVLIALLALGGYAAVAVGQTLGGVAVVTALSSVASAVTVLLARIFLKQPVAWRGWAGLFAVVAGSMALRLG